MDAAAQSGTGCKFSLKIRGFCFSFNSRWSGFGGEAGQAGSSSPLQVLKSMQVSQLKYGFNKQLRYTTCYQQLIGVTGPSKPFKQGSTCFARLRRCLASRIHSQFHATQEALIHGVAISHGASLWVSHPKASECPCHLSSYEQSQSNPPQTVIPAASQVLNGREAVIVQRAAEVRTCIAEALG